MLNAKRADQCIHSESLTDLLCYVRGKNNFSWRNRWWFPTPAYTAGVIHGYVMKACKNEVKWFAVYKCIPTSIQTQKYRQIDRFKFRFTFCKEEKLQFYHYLPSENLILANWGECQCSETYTVIAQCQNMSHAELWVSIELGNKRFTENESFLNLQSLLGKRWPCSESCMQQTVKWMESLLYLNTTIRFVTGRTIKMFS